MSRDEGAANGSPAWYARAIVKAEPIFRIVFFAPPKEMKMHVEPTVTPPLETNLDSGPWHRGLTRYHWFVLIVCALGWMFDTMDQHLFNLAQARDYATARSRARR